MRVLTKVDLLIQTDVSPVQAGHELGLKPAWNRENPEMNPLSSEDFTL